MNTLIIKIDDLETKGEISETIENFKCPEIENIAESQLFKITYNAIYNKTEINVFGEIKGSLNMVCCKCLEKFEFKINIPIEVTYPTDQKEINLSNEIKELIILYLPDNPLCNENCLGLCPICGKNRNKTKCSCEKTKDSPQWNRLKDLLNK